ncbi:MAG: penicillin acylase family protein [Bacteroidia bacterium]|nr:penicillin acylase family protein [Bacteroidia bacterium]
MKKFVLILLLSGIQYSFCQINPANIQIARDSFGTPHIFAPTDAEVAYGFAWATAEDDFETMQMQLLAVRGLMGQVNGKQGAFFDVAVHILDPHTIVEERFEHDISESYKKILKGYAAGANAFAQKYPKRVLHKDLFPINEKDVIKGYIVGMALLSGVDKSLTTILNEEVAAFKEAESRGSNAFALSSKKTADGHTFLAINSHQPLEGLNSWYEAHLCSEEGWNILGATFAGGASIFVGTNENLGWGHTVNHPDLADIYELNMNPENKMEYRFDGEWLTLEPYHTKARIKLLGFLPIALKQKFYKSKYGVTMRTDEGVFALRFPANFTVKAAEQWYNMNKATNLEEFKEALSMQGIISTNVVYADKEDNIYYISNGYFPIRNKAYNWKSVLPGDTSATLWSRFYPYDSCVQVQNPASGFVYNCNNTPFVSTGEKDNPDFEAVPLTMGYQKPDQLTNRAVRLEKLLTEKEKISWKEFVEIKYDQSYAIPPVSYPKLVPLFTIDPEKYPQVSENLHFLQTWDGEADLESTEASLFILTVYRLNKILKGKNSLREGKELTEAKLIEAFEWAQDHLIKNFGSSKVKLGDLQQLSRGDKRIPYAGGPDVLAAVGSRFRKDGTLKPYAGDSYIEMVRFTDAGPEIYSINAYGASADPKSPHYDDQMDNFVSQKLRRMTLDKESVLKAAVKVYSPD